MLKKLLSFLGVAVLLISFQNCSGYRATNGSALASMSAASQTSGLQTSSRSLKELYYYVKDDYEFEVHFDLEKKKADLRLKLIKEFGEIKKQINLSDRDIAKIKEVLDDLQIKKSLRPHDLDNSVEYIIPYFENSSAYQAYLETSAAPKGVNEIIHNNELIKETLKEIVSNKLGVDINDVINEALDKWLQSQSFSLSF